MPTRWPEQIDFLSSLWTPAGFAGEGRCRSPAGNFSGGAYAASGICARFGGFSDASRSPFFRTGRTLTTRRRRRRFRKRVFITSLLRSRPPSQAQQGSGASLNSVLARDLLLALAGWRKQVGLPDNIWLRLMLPVNMRAPGDRRMPAANVVSTVFLDCRLADGLDPGALSKDIHRLMENVKRNDFGVAWLLAIRLLQLMPRAWARVRGSRRRCLSQRPPYKCRSGIRGLASAAQWGAVSSSAI